VDAGADCIITQLFYDVDLYEKWVKDCRSFGINVPIIPGIMPINTYGGFDRMVGFCKTKVPKQMREGMDAVKVGSCHEVLDQVGDVATGACTCHRNVLFEGSRL